MIEQRNEANGEAMNLFCKVINQSSQKEVKEAEQSQGISASDENRLLTVEYKSQAYASFYATSMEKDKTLLALSVGGIGFLVTLLNLASLLQLWHIGLFLIASIAYVVSIHNILTIFGENKSYIIAITQDHPTEYIDNRLSALDRRAVRSFYLGLILTICLGVATSWTLINKGERSMTDKNEKTIQTVQSGYVLKEPVWVENKGKSVGGARTMAPKQSSSSENTPTTISVRGAESMKPPKKTDDK